LLSAACFEAARKDCLNSRARSRVAGAFVFDGPTMECVGFSCAQKTVPYLRTLERRPSFLLLRDTASHRKKQMRITERLLAFTLLGSEWVLWLLIGLSLISVTVMVERNISMAAFRPDLEGLGRKLLSLLGQGDYQG